MSRRLRTAGLCACILAVCLAVIGVLSSPGGGVASAASTTGNTYYVSPIGNDAYPGTAEQPWRTIAKAVTRMNAGDTLLVRGGRYDEFIPIGWDTGASAKSGSPTAPITLKAYPGERAVLTNDESWPLRSRNRYNMIEIRERSHWIIEGFVFDHTTSPTESLWWAYGISAIGPAKGLVIQGNTFEGNGRVRHGGTVINLTYDLQDCLIENNVFQNWPSQSDVMGITLETYWRDKEALAIPNRNTIIRRNTFDGLGGDGVHIGPWAGHQTLIENNVFRAKYNDDANGTAENAIDIKRSFFTVVRGNRMSGFRPKYSNPRGEAILIHLMAEDVLVENNLIYDNGTGITAAAGNPDEALPTPAWYQGTKRLHRITISRNIIIDANRKPAFDGRPGFGRGIDANGVEGLKIYHNVLAYCDSVALGLAELKQAEVRNNIFYRSHNDLLDDTAGGTDFRELVIGANLFNSRHSKQIVHRTRRNAAVGNNLARFRAMTGQAAGSLQVPSPDDLAMDPVFVYPSRDVDEADYHLKPFSPAIDAGDYIPQYSDGFLGKAPDMGVLEYEERSN